MIDRKALTRIAKMVAAEMKKGRMSSALPRALKPLEEYPEHVLDLVELLAKEGLKKRPNEALIAAYAFILARSLDMLRYAVERGDPVIVALVEHLRMLLLEAESQGRITPAVLMIVLHQFASAKLDAGDDLRELMHHLMEQDGEAQAAVARGEARDHFAQIAAESENDPFAIHTCLDESMETLPEAMQAGLVMAAFGENVPAVREASLGFLLSKSDDARAQLVELLTLAAPHGLVSATMLRRMIAIRSWLPRTQRTGLDVAIKTARAKGVGCAPTAKADIVDVLVSGVDGSGAVTVLAIARDGRRHALAGLLLKQGFGIRDAWVRRGLSKAELREILDHVGGEIDVAPSNPDYLATILQQSLAINLERGNPPPFATLDVAETCGIAEINPVPMPVEALVAKCLAEADPSCLAESALMTTLRESGDWVNTHPILETWFEDDVSKLVGGNRTAHKKRLAVLLAGPLQARRRRWAELCAWMAQSLKYQGDADWQSFAVVARELLGKRPLDEIGLMTTVATTTLQVIEMQALLGLGRARANEIDRGTLRDRVESFGLDETEQLQ